MIATANRLVGWGRQALRAGFVWGFVDQGLSSLTNFGLSLIAGRLLGPRGLGSVFLAFSAYLIVLQLQRALLTEVLLVLTSALGSDEREPTARIGLTLSILVGLASTVVILGLGAVVPGAGGTGLLALGPWMLPLLVQDFWRNLLFRERRSSAAAANDGCWLAVMVAFVPIALWVESEATVMAVWGLGAVGGTFLGFAQTRLRPSPIREAIRWWRTQAWPFGRWNGAATIVVNVASNASAFIIAGILGARALGGFRAVQSLFAPLSVIAPSLALPGLPAVARAYSLGFRPARDLALRVSAIAVAVSLSFFAVLFLGGWRLLPLLFGSAFERYRAIIPAMAVGQVLAAAGIGFPLLIKVQQRGRFLLTARLIATILGVIVVTIGAAVNGLMGATWGLAGASLIATAAVAVGAIEPRRPEVVRTRTGSVGPVP